jgi:hypothetical protein
MLESIARPAPSDVTSASEGFVGLFLLIDVLAVAALIGIWYLCLSQYNRKKGAMALSWMEAACSGKGEILEAKWLTNYTLQARLRFAGHWFENARVTLKLLPRPLPVQWILSLWRKEEETLTFEADLDCTPGFQLEVYRHRWLTQKPRQSVLPTKHRNWTVSRPGPVVLTTRTEWDNELTPVVNTLMTSRGHGLISVRFRTKSPHLAATVPLQALSDKQTASSFLNVLRDLAAGASTSHQ